MKQVVVGVDGSECAAAALDEAAVEAELRGVPLHVICAWEIPIIDYGAGFAPLDAGTVDLIEQRASAVADEAVAKVKQRRPSVDVTGKSSQRQPAAALLEAAKDASLIVVGNRGLGGFRSLMLGSVSHQVVLHAECPVLVVKGAEAGAD